MCIELVPACSPIPKQAGIHLKLVLGGNVSHVHDLDHKKNGYQVAYILKLLNRPDRTMLLKGILCILYFYYCDGLTPGLRNGSRSVTSIIVNWVSAFAESSIADCNIVTGKSEYSLT